MARGDWTRRRVGRGEGQEDAFDIQIEKGAHNRVQGLYRPDAMPRGASLSRGAVYLPELSRKYGVCPDNIFSVCIGLGQVVVSFVGKA